MSELRVFKQRQYSKWLNSYPSSLIRALYHAQRNLPAGHFGDSSQNQKWCRYLLQWGWCPGPRRGCRAGRRSDPSRVCWSGRWPPAAGCPARARRCARTGTCQSTHTALQMGLNSDSLWTGLLLTDLFCAVNESDKDWLWLAGNTTEDRVRTCRAVVPRHINKTEHWAF